ncbi:MAG TPA: hypothetical protein VMU77_01660, partial [Acidimicrobiales bacterium]|nr:hypothetical protein [Acidimicrobiales bacterium]
MRRGILAALLVIFAVAAWSFFNALNANNTDPLSAKSVEWVRNHGGSAIVRWSENFWYSHHQPPPLGKPQAGSVPTYRADTGFSSHPSMPHLPTPKSLETIISPPLQGEGSWTPVGRLVGGYPAVYATYLRSDPAHTSVVAGIAWMDSQMLRATLFSGNDVPGGIGWSNMAPLNDAESKRLVAVFNSGFRMQDANGGYYTDGKTAFPLVQGAASLVIYRNGTATVAQWGRDASMGPNVASVRQNLDLIVDRGKPVPNLLTDNFAKWGATLGNSVLVWRSGLGVTANGALVYAGGSDLSVYTLANVLAHAGAVRAMELDINTDWVNYFFFDQRPGFPASPANGTKLLPNMIESLDRYFQPSSRDFIT